MKIVVDDKIPYIKGAFEQVAEVKYLAGAKTTPNDVKDADAIVTRTRTICNENLLSGSQVKFIATATIGFDHIDTDYCAKAGIRWTNAPGCNSGSVEQYIASTLVVLSIAKGWNLSEKTLGVVGVGNVGKKVAKVAKILGMQVLLNDPPRERAEGSDEFVSLATVMSKSDIITLHVPLNMKGEDPTYHLANPAFFELLEKHPVLINSCRGEVVQTQAVKEALKKHQIAGFVCDCWENEPNLDLELLSQTLIATPHIAGYSKDGKAVGTTMSVRAISDFFDLGLNNWEPKEVELPEQPEINIDGNKLSEWEVLSKAILHTYDIREDDSDFRKNTDHFEQLRGDYHVRREFGAYTVNARNIKENIIEKLRQLGFQIKMN